MNLLDKLCKELGVEVGEKWLANDGYYYKITEDGMIGFYYPISADEIGFDVDIELWASLVIGELKPVWKPKNGEVYYIPNPTYFTKEFRFTERKWTNAMYDHEALRNNMIFKTKEEAIEVANKMLRAI